MTLPILQMEIRKLGKAVFFRVTELFPFLCHEIWEEEEEEVSFKGVE